MSTAEWVAWCAAVRPLARALSPSGFLGPLGKSLEAAGARRQGAQTRTFAEVRN